MPDDAKPATEESKLGRFIQKYATLLSSTVLGIAGLAATSIWQFRQSATAEQQAQASQHVAETSADNSWKIERADILSKNLATLASSGPGTVEQRYGVLLSLTRGAILDPELAVSYALELGKDSPEDMQSVLANTTPKNYTRLAHAYALSCDERYGTTANLDICTNKLAGRSSAIGQLFADDTEATLPSGQPGPMIVLSNERVVQLDVRRFAALFTQTLTAMYERRAWDEIAQFMAASPGAHLVASLVLSAAHTGEFVTDDEAKQLQSFHDQQTKWLVDYLIGKTCDPECKARMVDLMVSHYSDALGSYDAVMRQLLEGSRAQSSTAVTHLHSRLLWCQLDENDLVPLRDQVLVPAATLVVTSPTADPAVRDAIVSLIALVSEPAPTEVAPTVAWIAMIAAIDKAGEKYTRTLKDRRAIAAKQRVTPPTANLKKTNFCAAVPDANGPTDSQAGDPGLTPGSP